MEEEVARFASPSELRSPFFPLGFCSHRLKTTTEMKTAPRFLLFLALALMALVTVGATECEVGEDGTCVGASTPEVEVEAEEATTTKQEEAVEIDENCPDRDHIVRCTGAHLDTNGNGKLDRNELDDGK